MSTHKVEVTRLPDEFQKHSNADSLSLVNIFGGYQVVIRTEDWTPGQLVAYIPPDSIVPNNETFAFLDGHTRIRAKRLRGEMSFGLLIPAPAGTNEGDDVTELLGVTHWNPAVPTSTGGEDTQAPRGFFPVYDIESWRRYSRTFRSDEEVVISEKIHGCSARFVFQDGQMCCGSHRNWKKDDSQSPNGPKNLWWKALEQNPKVKDFCLDNPGVALYAEVFGSNVQDLPYGKSKGEFGIRVFDVLADGQWVSFERPGGTLVDYLNVYGVEHVPVLYRGPYSEEIVKSLVDGKSTLADHLREGVVIKPVRERTDPKIGRVILKAVSGDYLARKSKG